jgi:uncharacterized protein YktA (UPF0223 family)
MTYDEFVATVRKAIDNGLAVEALSGHLDAIKAELAAKAEEAERARVAAERETERAAKAEAARVKAEEGTRPKWLIERTAWSEEIERSRKEIAEARKLLESRDYFKQVVVAAAEAADPAEKLRILAEGREYRWRPTPA